MTTPDPDSPADVTGFVFPGRFELTVMGDADADLLALVASEMRAAGVERLECEPREKISSGGRFRSVSASFACVSRQQLEALHAALKAHPAVKWTL